jgi:hypothetical protein
MPSQSHSAITGPRGKNATGIETAKSAATVSMRSPT